PCPLTSFPTRRSSDLTLANAIAYVEAALKAGLEIDDFAPRLSFFFNSHSNFLQEIAKFRAARRLYAHLMRDRFKARNPKSMMLRDRKSTRLNSSHVSI